MYFDEKFKEFLEKKTGWSKFNGAKTELMTLCPFPDCDIDRGKQKNGHLYIDASNPIFFCQRCNTTGTVFKLIRQLNGDPSGLLDMNHDIFKYHKSRNLDTSSITVTDDKSRVKIENQDLDLYKQKSLYLKGRLGFTFNLDLIPNLILGIKDFVDNNHIKLNLIEKQYLPYYESSYIGFLGSRRNDLILRYIGQDLNMRRYIKIKLVQDSLFKDFYGIQTNYIGKDNTIVLVEGTFDLLVAIYSNELDELRKRSCFWAAILGSYFSSVIPSVLDYIKIPYTNVVILADRDKKLDDKIFEKVKNSPMVGNLEIFYNQSGEDFGMKPINPIGTVFQKKEWKRRNGKFRRSQK